jgi:heat shock protein HtpX
MVGFAYQVKTVLLLGILTTILLIIGSLFGKGGLIIALVFVVLMNTVTYFFSDKIALFFYRAKKLEKKDNPRLHQIIKDLAHQANIPEPVGIYLIPSPQANAFCAGRGPSHYVVACTEGILKLLDDEELRGVLAHELSHAKNRDVLVATIAATIAGVISYLAHMAQWAAIFGGGGDEENGWGGIVGMLALAILTPIIALLIQMAISRSREYLADETGARLVRNGKPLARALEKIEKSVKDQPMNFGAEAASSLFIANPFKASFLLNMFSTHPPMEERVKRLHAIRF